MFAMENAFLKLLANNIIFDDKIIPFVKNYADLDRTPCFTINQADEVFKKRRYVQIDGAEYIRKRYTSNLWINIWCNTEKERHSIMKQIQHRIFQAEANHYTTCHYYDNENCSLTESRCEALTRTDTNARANKKQCPDINHYQSFFQTHNIIKNTFQIDSVTDLDELDPSREVLRTIFKLTMDYYQYYEIGGKPFTDFELEGFVK